MGLTRCVRPPRPWRPSKLRYWWRRNVRRVAGCPDSFPGTSNIRIHATQNRLPGKFCPSLPSRPGLLPSAIRAQPSPSRCHSHDVPWPRERRRRKSSRRELVQEPMKTRSTEIASTLVPGSRPIYSNTRSADCRSASVPNAGSSGTRPFTGITMPGLVPHVTNGASLDASISMTVS